MKKVMISQPMGSRTYAEVLIARSGLRHRLEELGYEVLDNLFTDKPTADVVNPKIYYLSKAVTLMTKADIMVFMDGWKESRGCRIEYDIAVSYGLMILDESALDYYVDKK